MSDLNVTGLDEVAQVALDACYDQLISVSGINRTRREYFEAKQRVRKLGIAIPPHLGDLEAVLGWPYKAVKSLATRVKLGGFAAPGQDVAAFGIDRIWADNRLAIEAHHAHMSALTYGVAFVSVLAGGAGEPPALIRALSPTVTTALWDANKRRASAALTITRRDGTGPVEFILFLEDRVITCARDTKASRWTIDEAEHDLGRCPVVVLAYDSSPEYPFGRSRITQGVMRITDEAIRNTLRTEVTAEFYSAPQRYMLGADETAFIGANGEQTSGWSAIIGRILALSANEDGVLPQVGQFPQMSMQPHTDHLRAIAAKFAGETNLPVNTLGIVHDNPASDAAMHTAYLDLNADAESAHEPFGAAWVDAMRMAVTITQGSDEGLELLTTKWRNPATPTRQAAAQWAMTLVQAGILPANSLVALEELGFDQTTIDRIVAERTKASAGSVLDRLASATATPTAATPGPAESSEAILEE